MAGTTSSGSSAMESSITERSVLGCVREDRRKLREPGRTGIRRTDRILPQDLYKASEGKRRSSLYAQIGWANLAIFETLPRIETRQGVLPEIKAF